MKKHKVVVAGKVLPVALDVLQQECELHVWQQAEAMPPDLLYDWIKDAQGLFATNKIQVNEELLAHAPQLKVIAQAAVGYDNVNIHACSAHGIPFANTPGVLVEATADLAFGLILCSARRIAQGWEWVKEGQWASGRALPLGIDLFGKTLGIVGMGQIGAAVARRAQASGMKVIYHNRSRRRDEQEMKASYVSFDELLQVSDFVLVLVPLSAESKGLFGREQFRKMKPSAYFINAARGAIVDAQALYEALRDQTIAFAAMDVTDPEPIPTGHPLVRMPNILITPHIGSATVETRTEMALLTAKNILAGLAGKPLLTCVNSEANYK